MAKITVLKLDPESRDLCFDADGIMDHLEDAEAIAQNIRNNLNTWKGEFELDTSHGTEWERIVESTDAIDVEADDATQYIYMVLKSSTKAGDKYDEYMVIDGAVERVGDWTVDLSGYVQKEEGKDLSSNDFTDEEKAKLAKAITEDDMASDEEVAEMLDQVFGAVSED